MDNRNEALYIDNGESAGRNNVCISGYDKNKPNYALSNFESNDGKGYEFLDKDIGKVKFPTAEHYLHFQKLSKEGKLQYKEHFENEASPSAILKFIKTVPDNLQLYKKPDGTFNDEAWNKQKYKVQMQINASKYAQSPAFKQCIDNAIQLGKNFGDNGGAACIIEDTATAAHEEKIWGTGPDGRGTNMLGNSQTAFANMVANGVYKGGTSTTPMFGSFNTNGTEDAYRAAEKQYQDGVQKALIEAREPLPNKKVDTSDIPGVQKLTVTENTALPVKEKIAKKEDEPIPEPEPVFSRLETEPAEQNPPRPTREQQDRTANFLHPENLKKVVPHMKSLGWDARPAEGDGSHATPIIFSKGTEEFTMTANSYTTQSTDVNTFIAMLEAYRIANPGKEPSITSNSAAMTPLWEAAYREVYKKDPPAATIKTLGSEKPDPKSAPGKEPSEPEIESPRMGGMRK